MGFTLGGQPIEVRRVYGNRPRRIPSAGKWVLQTKQEKIGTLSFRFNKNFDINLHDYLG